MDKYSEYSIENIIYKIKESDNSIEIEIYNKSLNKLIYSNEYYSDPSITPENFIKDLCYDSSFPIEIDLLVISKIIKKVIPNISLAWADKYYMSLKKDKEYTEYFS